MHRDLELLLAFLAPIRGLLLDDSVTEIMGNPDGSWWFERAGRMHFAEITFDAEQLRTAIEVIASTLGRKLEGNGSLLNAQLPDGSRLSATLPPVARPGPSLTVRKFSTVRLTVRDLVDGGAMPSDVAVYLRQQVQQGRTMLISGGTGSGKTTLLNAIADLIPDSERLVVIEDTSELRIAKPNVIGAECQAGHVDFNALLKASLRWRPDRIILGEVRGEEARTLLDSFNTGHAGSMATIHASSAVRALRRFTELAMRSHQQAVREDIAQEIAESVQVVVQVQRVAEGRRISEVIEVRGYDRSLKTFLYDAVYNVDHSLPTLQNLTGETPHAHA